MCVRFMLCAYFPCAVHKYFRTNDRAKVSERGRKKESALVWFIFFLRNVCLFRANNNTNRRLCVFSLILFDPDALDSLRIFFFCHFEDFMENCNCSDLCALAECFSNSIFRSAARTANNKSRIGETSQRMISFSFFWPFSSAHKNPLTSDSKRN